MTKSDETTAIKHIKDANSIVIIQAENPDGDSLGSALALEQLLGKAGKEVHLYCPVDIPKYLRYLDGWDRISIDLPSKFDLSIIVDTSASSLLERLLIPSNLKLLSSKPSIIIDHHDAEPNLPFETINIIDTQAVAAGQIVYELSLKLPFELDRISGTAIATAIMSDSMGFVSSKTTARTLHIIGELMEKCGVSLAEIDERRRAEGKRTIEIVSYKADLLKRIEYHLDNRLAMVTIPLSEIEQYSDQYNPGMLMLEEMRNTEEVQVAIALKVYNNRITGKLRANEAQICDQIASYFGGGGHPYAAGFKTDSWKLDELKKEIIKVTKDLLEKAK